ncbi:hypothetical protein [Rhizobium etli]|uniref:Uncharacterized protein n=1 Tax=Rhizobium etli TaxID=29449 RepID=A0A7W7ECI4_RHIET|nr:hypothetical protein [Rhizobium etli]MBB4478021.1 hypothetical protein [Rhizobium etli]MBB4533853.1 hypothetical protein [Rhizobium etli]
MLPAARVVSSLPKSCNHIVGIGFSFRDQSRQSKPMPIGRFVFSCDEEMGRLNEAGRMPTRDMRHAGSAYLDGDQKTAMKMGAKTLQGRSGREDRTRPRS